MGKRKQTNITTETLREVIGAVIYDLTAYIGTAKEPFIVGGQYSNKLFLEAVRMWCFKRKLDLTHPAKAEEVWRSLCEERLLAGGKPFTHPPRPLRLPPAPPAPPAPPPPPRPLPESLGDGHQNDSPAGEPDTNSDDSWKDDKDRKADWRDEGEDWKKEGDDDKT